MKRKNKSFLILDLFYISLMILPVLVGIIIKVVTTPPSEGIQITGARIFCKIPFVIQDIIITEAQINSWLVMIAILGLCPMTYYPEHYVQTQSKLQPPSCQPFL